MKRFAADSVIGSVLPGTRRYRIEQVLASGGLAHVYLASTEEGEHVAVKLMRPELETKRDVVARFEREALAASRVQHDNVVRVYEPAQTALGFSFFATEHLVGVDLADVLASHRKLQPARAIRVALGAAAGLQASHDAGVVHRDVKPENLFLVHRADGREVLKVLDFGSAALETDTVPTRTMRITMTTGFVGTPGYLAPEQAEGKRGHPSADIYSLGVVLYEALGGRPPFAGRTWVELVTKHARDPVPPLTNVSPALSQAILRCLEKRPEDRFASMNDLIAALSVVPEAERV